jgi:hypothetical protein
MMVLKWLRQKREKVIFRNNAIDQALLESVRAELARQPGLSFSSLCKEALHQYLLSERTYSELANSPIDRRIESLEAQLRGLEQRFSAQDKRRLDRLETQLQQLAAQVVQLGGTVPAVGVSPEEAAETIPYAEEAEEPTIDDPVLSRLSGLIDDF